MNQNFYNSNSPDFDQSQPSQFLVIHQDPQEISIQEMEDLKQQYLDEMKHLINLEHRDKIKIDELKGNFNSMSIEISKKEKLQQLDMGDEHLDTIPEKESDEFNKSSVEDLVQTQVNSRMNVSVICPIVMILKRHIFQCFPILSSTILPLVMTSQVMRSEFNPIHNEDLDSTPKNNRFDSKFYLIESFLNRDESIPPGIDCDNSNSEGDTLSLERLLHDDPIPLPDTFDFDFSNVI
nr:hypothetical protein [Tanacetum cinerariifolium]